MNIRALTSTLTVIAAFAAADSALAQSTATAPKLNLPIAPGPFVGTMESLTNYQCPEWFRDAKFGIWAHWGPQAVPMDGDWYARGMYEPGNKHYAYHTNNYGHPSKFGYKDIIPLWKAEKWDPDRLMALYKKAGAKYFVSMGTHHDNYFLWDSKLHRWNSVNMGPKCDVVATWEQAARKLGLRFGVSEHLGASFTWFQSSHRSDKTGPLAGVPYDGANPAYEELYHFPAEPGDTGWYSKNPRWHQQWYNSINELISNYQLDLLYTDGGVPFANEVGLSQIANLYNTDLLRSRASTKDLFPTKGASLLISQPQPAASAPQVIYNCKQKSGGRWVEDLERGVMPGINPHPWQTDTSIGDWYYNRNWKFRPVSWTIHMLVDIVSKNGNLLLNIVQRPDGSLDPEVEQALEDLAAWGAVHGEAIYGTRPWLVYGEGAVKAKGGNFKEDFNYTAKDIRFTTKGGALYAFALGWPDDGQLTIRTLARPAGAISSVSLLGYKGQVQWSQTADGLVVKLPAQKTSAYTAALKITGTNLKPVPIVEVIEPISADANGNFQLRAEDVELHGQQLKQETQGNRMCVGFWDNADEWVSWNVRFAAPGRYQVSASCATTHPGSPFVLEVAGQSLPGKAKQTGAWDTFANADLGVIDIKQAGVQMVKVRPQDTATWQAMNLRSVRLSKVQ